MKNVIEEAKNLLTEADLPPYLPAIMHYYANNKDSFCSYLGVVSNKVAQKCLTYEGWTIPIGRDLVGFSQRFNNQRVYTKYYYAPATNDCWPIMISQNFSGIKDNQLTLLEEFRLYHNLWLDKESGTYYKFLDNGEKQKIVYNEDQNYFIDTLALRQYCSAKKLKLLLQVHAIKYISKQDEIHERKEEKGIIYNHSIVHLPLSAFDDEDYIETFIGKRLIGAFSRKDCGIWPYLPKRKIESFIIGTTATGKPILSSRNLEENSSSGMVLVYFKKDVLSKYYQYPSSYSIGDGYIQYKNLWRLDIDNDLDDQVSVYLCDLIQLPFEEQSYWKSFNIQPTKIISQTFFDRTVRAQFCESKNPDVIIQNLRNDLQKQWKIAFGFNLYRTFTKNDSYLLNVLHSPITDDWFEFNQCLINASKIFIDYLNESDLAKLAQKEIDRIRTSDPTRKLKGIDKLEIWLLQNNAPAETINSLKGLRLLQALRSSSAAHAQGKNFKKLLDRENLTNKTNKEIFSVLMKHLITYCYCLIGFAIDRTHQ